MTLGELSGCPLFDGIAYGDLAPMLDCLGAVNREYGRESFIFTADSRAQSVGIVVAGGVFVIQEDFWGNRQIIAHITAGGLFGESYACAGTEKIPVSVVAAEQSEILLIDYGKIVNICDSACSFHTALIMNMLRILAEKNIFLTQKMEHLSRKTTREKLLSYLSALASSARSNVIEIPFNRQDLADYLCVDRSALSRELSRMHGDGLLSYEKNRFELLKDAYS